MGYKLKRYKLYLFRSVWFFQIEPARYLYIWKVLLPHPKFIAPISFCGLLREMSRLCNMFSPKTVANLINSKHYFWLQMLVQNLCYHLKVVWRQTGLQLLGQIAYGLGCNELHFSDYFHSYWMIFSCLTCFREALRMKIALLINP